MKSNLQEEILFKSGVENVVAPNLGKSHYAVKIINGEKFNFEFFALFRLSILLQINSEPYPQNIVANFFDVVTCKC